MSAEPLAPPSPLVTTNTAVLRASSGLGPVVDLACGRGRHVLAVAEAGVPCIGVDRQPGFLVALVNAATRGRLPVRAVRADLETRHGLPLRAASCGAILVFRFLYRPLAQDIERALAPGGLLLYETFTTQQRELGTGPRNAAFLLEPDELRGLFPNLEVLTYDEGLRGDTGAPTEASARLLARRPSR